MDIDRARDHALNYLRHLAGQDDAPEGEVRAALEAVRDAVAAELDGLATGRRDRSERLKAWRLAKRRRVAEKLEAKRLRARGGGEVQSLAAGNVDTVAVADLAG